MTTANASEYLDYKTSGKNKFVAVNKSGLPETYNETKVVILPRDPVWIYAYWEISSETTKKLLKQYNENLDTLPVIVRVYDITDINFNGRNAHRYFDIKVNRNALSWYINVGEYNRSWCIDIGYILKSGDYIIVARSNSMIMPKYGVSDIIDENWALMKLEFEKFLKISNTGQTGKSSYDIARFIIKQEEIFK
ncbi:MAG: DUF4912 domain-containing protein [Endomicrobium sp.]|jgi:hypothetical protein|nr:DUF4912 domain-containing protein [Endomicrobium sp.]